MKKTILAIAAALLFTAPAMAQTVSVGRSVTSPKSFGYVNVEDSWDVGSGFRAVAEARVGEGGKNSLKVGAKRELATIGPVTLSGRVNVVQKFGKQDYLGYSVEPTAAFKVGKANVVVGYEVGDTFQSKYNDEVRTTKVTVTQDFGFGDIGFKVEDGRGDRRSSNFAVVYVLKH